MNKVLLSFLIFSISLFSVCANAFNDLHLDLLNFWRLGKNSVYLNDISRISHTPSFTGNTLDFFIFGFGFFVVMDDINNVYYLTRNGRFSFNRRGFLTNEDGYYVLNTNKEFIHFSHIDFSISNFRDHFFIAIPIDDYNVIIKSNYIIVQHFIPAPHFYGVGNKILELLPISLSELLEKALLDIDANRGFDNDEKLIALIYKRYFQLKEWNFALPDDSIFWRDDDYFTELLNKIEIFEQRLFNNQ